MALLPMFRLSGCLLDSRTRWLTLCRSCGGLTAIALGAPYLQLVWPQSCRRNSYAFDLMRSSGRGGLSIIPTRNERGRAGAAGLLTAAAEFDRFRPHRGGTRGNDDET